MLIWEFNVPALSKAFPHMLQRYSLAEERLRFEAAAIITTLYVSAH